MDIKGERSVSLRVWDIGGQSLNSKNLEKYISSSQIIFLVYDVTNPTSFENLDDWIIMVNKFNTANAQVYVVGNKIDLIALRQVTEKQQEAKISGNGLYGGLYVSAKTRENLVKTFYKVAAEAIGIALSPYELAFYDSVVKAHINVSNSDGEGRTLFADDIEAEDAAADKRRREEMLKPEGCCICS